MALPSKMLHDFPDFDPPLLLLSHGIHLNREVHANVVVVGRITWQLVASKPHTMMSFSTHSSGPLRLKLPCFGC